MGSVTLTHAGSPPFASSVQSGCVTLAATAPLRRLFRLRRFTSVTMFPAGRRWPRVPAPPAANPARRRLLRAPAGYTYGEMASPREPTPPAFANRTEAGALL